MRQPGGWRRTSASWASSMPITWSSPPSSKRWSATSPTSAWRSCRRHRTIAIGRTAAIFEGCSTAIAISSTRASSPKQRFRWALGGIQILRRQWRDLVPFAPHRLRLTMGQRLAYLFGSVHWFSDLLTVGFTALLLLTAVAAALHHRLPIRELTGPILVVPLAFLISGVLRGLWALRRAERCSWGDALRALAIWFALSWVDTLAVVRGLLSGQAAFLRTPKQKEGGNRLWPAIRSSAIESLLAILAVVGAIVLLLAAPALATVILAIMLLFEAWIFGSAPWASLAAEGIQLTPQRRIYLRSAQN